MSAFGGKADILLAPITAFIGSKVLGGYRSLSCCVDDMGERTTREARLSHYVVFLSDAE